MSLFVRESGPADAPTVVLVHGGGMSGWTWEPQIQTLTSLHLLVPDLPEHGRSAGRFSHAAAVAELADLIGTHAHGGRAFVAGLSLGGQVVLQLLADHPELVSKALTSGALARPAPGLALANLMARPYWPFRAVPSLLRAGMRTAGIPDAYLPQVRDEIQATTLEAYMRLTTANFAFVLPTELTDVTVPTLVLVGGKEPEISRQSARATALSLPKAVGYVAPGVHHAWNMEAPDLFDRVLLAWVEDRSLPTELLPLPLTAA